MTELQGGQLFPTPDSVEADRQRDLTTGLLPSQLLREAVAQGREILSPQPIGDDQIQPASIDLRLGEVAYRVRASFLPGARSSKKTAFISSRCSNMCRCANAPRRPPTRRARPAGSMSSPG